MKKLIVFLIIASGMSFGQSVKNKIKMEKHKFILVDPKSPSVGYLSEYNYDNNLPDFIFDPLKAEWIKFNKSNLKLYPSTGEVVKPINKKDTPVTKWVGGVIVGNKVYVNPVKVK